MLKLRKFISFVCDKYYNIFPTFWRVKKFGRFIKRLFLWIPTIYRIENWDYEYLIDIMVIQLKQMEIALSSDTMVVCAPARAKQIRIVLEHIKRYKNIEEYVEHISNKEYFNNQYWSPEGKNLTRLCHIDEVLRHQHLLIDKRASDLENWHLTEAFRIIGKRVRGWWT